MNKSVLNKNLMMKWSNKSWLRLNLAGWIYYLFIVNEFYIVIEFSAKEIHGEQDYTEGTELIRNQDEKIALELNLNKKPSLEVYISFGRK